MKNRAAWYTAAKAHPFEIDDAPMPEPGPHQAIVRSRAVAINPADFIVQAQGILVTGFPSVLGEDVAGEVVSVGKEVTRFKPGDRVTAFGADLSLERPFSGTFQLYCRINDDSAAKIPDNVTYNEACVLPLALNTAASALFPAHNLNLPVPQHSPRPTGMVLLVWGGSSSVGSCAIQLARAAGLEVATTCSSHNFEYCRGLGADLVFDYKSATIVADVVEALKGKQSAGIFSSVSDSGAIVKSAQIASDLGGNKFVATVLPPGLPLPQNLPSDVKMGYDNSNEIRSIPAGPAMWEHWLNAALASGAMQCKPSPQVVGSGLEKIQEAVDLMGKGVSAQKLVVEL